MAKLKNIEQIQNNDSGFTASIKPGSWIMHRM